MTLRCSKILITGGSSGIGLAIAKRLTQDGAEVVITGRDTDKLSAAVESIGCGCKGSITWDVKDVSHISAVLEEAEHFMQGLDGLVNNAAVGSSKFGRGYEPWDLTAEEWDLVADTDLRSPFFLMRDFIEYLKTKSRKGNILNISSNATCMDIVGPYGTSKLGLLKLTRALGKRYGSDGIIINGIAPGATFTPMIRYYAQEIDQPYPRHAIGRYIKPEEIAELAAYLMSVYGEIICGHTVIADGGDRAATL